jgi:hypothetical protein
MSNTRVGTPRTMQSSARVRIEVGKNASMPEVTDDRSPQVLSLQLTAPDCTIPSDGYSKALSMCSMSIWNLTSIQQVMGGKYNTSEAK